MTDHFVFAFILLGWVLSPFLAWLVYWVVRRIFFRKEEGDAEAEGS